ncbi:MAG: hypothetical protein Q9P14_13945 [candidate division KSB1 bacterium]|nr:hypothetical protein [candidate division KSB1 bacterium]
MQEMKIGFDRRIRLEWLEKAVRYYRAGLPASQILNLLLEEVSERLAVGKSKVNRGSGKRPFLLLMKIWIRPDEFIEPLRQSALELFDKTPAELHIVLHWGMATAVYPFWESVAFHTGRMIRLQQRFTSAQIYRRLIEKYGDRSTVKDATRRVLKSMYDWGVIKDAKSKNMYTSDQPIPIHEIKLVAWLLESILYSSPYSFFSINELLNRPSLFPFELHYLI